jgi:hypothetical protein
MTLSLTTLSITTSIISIMTLSLNNKFSMILSKTTIGIKVLSITTLSIIIVTAIQPEI